MMATTEIIFVFIVTVVADGSDDGDDYFQRRRQLMMATAFENFDSVNMLMAMGNMTEMIII